MNPIETQRLKECTALLEKKKRIQMLRESIEKESRVIHCLEAQLACVCPQRLTSPCHHSGSAKATKGNYAGDQEGERDRYNNEFSTGKRRKTDIICDSVIPETSGDNVSHNVQLQQNLALLDFLDMLGSQSMNTVSSNLQQLLEEDDQVREIDGNEDPITYYRLMPSMSGIYFTHVSPPTPCNGKNKEFTRGGKGSMLGGGTADDAKYRLYELNGEVTPEIGALTFCISLVASGNSRVEAKSNTTAFSTCVDGFRIEELSVRFERTITSSLEVLQRCMSHHNGGFDSDVGPSISASAFPKEELEELASLASQTRNATKLFRDIVTFAEFDTRRTSALLELHDLYAHQGRFSILSPHKVRITLFSGNKQSKSGVEATPKTDLGVPLGFFDVVWKWRFSLLSSHGTDELWVESIQVAPNAPDPSLTLGVLRQLKDRGLDDLVSSLRGDCCKAIKLLLTAS